MNEAITKEENKKRFRDLVKMYHPDNKLTGDVEFMKKLNAAKDTDESFESFFDELYKIKAPKKEQEKNKRPARFKTDEEWQKWLKQYEHIKAMRKKDQDRERKKQRG